MKNVLISLMLLLAMGCQSYPEIGLELKQLGTGFNFTEGPAAAPNGDIYFTDIPNSRIHIWSPSKGMSTFRENSGGANGLLFDANGMLIVCEGHNRRVTSINSNGEATVLADKYNGKMLNKPNDLWIDLKGGIYFTDPYYGKKRKLDQDGEHVYYISPDRNKVTRVIDDMVRPNGIIGTPDGKMLYVTDHGGKKTFSYIVGAMGELSGKKLLAEEGSDGMTLDCDGNVYLTTDTVLVYRPDGKLLRRIKVPEKPANVCFGKDKRTLFITARKSLYAVKPL